MRLIAIPKFLVIALVASSLSWISVPQAFATTTTYSSAFTNGTAATTAQINEWRTFLTSLTGSYTKIVISSSTGASISVTDAVVVPNIATALKNSTTSSPTSTSYTIGSLVVVIGACGSDIELTIGPVGTSICQCINSGVYTVRPGIGGSNANWGGANNYTCSSGGSGVSQTLTVSFTEDAPSPNTFSTSQSSPTNISTGTTLTYSLIMSQSVTGLIASDFQLGGTSTCNSPVGLTGSGTTYSVTLTNCTEGTVILQLKANSVTGTTTTGPSSIASANTIVIDRTAPTISSVSAPSNGTYQPSGTLSFTLNMTETVTVSGTPRLPIVIGSTTRYATFASGSNSRNLVFSYVVQSNINDLDLNGITLNSAMELNGGSIVDLASNSLAALNVSTTTLASVLVAQRPSAPTIDSISASNAQLAVFFTPGASNGLAISNYEYSTNNGVNWIVRSPGATTSPLTITGLTNGQSYPVRLRAVNNAGAGDSSTAVSATPTAVVVGGGSNISMTYGDSASSSQFTASGGTGPYSFTLSSTPTGVTISNGVVSASSSTPAGTYNQNVVATDSGSQSGTKQFTITVAKASTSISISLPNSATTAALGGAVTITALVSRAGSVNFMIGGSTFSGCGNSSASTTTATCTWTPGALGSVSLTATFTPTDSSNFETSTTTSLSITVVNGVSTISLTLAGGVSTPAKGMPINIIAAVDQDGRVSFFMDGKRIPGCQNLVASIGNRVCLWTPAIQKQVNLTARLVPTNSVYNSSESSLSVRVIRRSGRR